MFMIGRLAFGCRWFRTVYYFALQELRTRFTGSIFGIFWAFLNPFVTLLVMKFFLEKGLKLPPGQASRFLWLAPGLFCWQFHAEILSSGITAYKDYRFLLKQRAFALIDVPWIKTFSAALVHVSLIGVVCAFEAWHGFFKATWIQLGYYFICGVLWTTSLNLLLSSLFLFLRDVQFVIPIVLQLGIWVTPVVWDTSTLPAHYHWMLLLNPFAYLVEGYRDSIFTGIWFWSKPEATLSFFAWLIPVWLGARWVHRRLQPSFADVVEA